jgi:RES domain-containing protein
VTHCYRLFRKKYSALDSRGAFLAGGRWNHKGVHMLYASSSLSLACLEILVHIREARLPADCSWVRITVPDGLVEQAPEDLDAADEDACRTFGSQWIASASGPVVEVPSVIVPTEKNLLLNPLHKRFGGLSFSEPEAFRFDLRLLKTGPRPL